MASQLDGSNFYTTVQFQPEGGVFIVYFYLSMAYPDLEYT